MTRRLLMTADAVGGVWQYAIELARGLVRDGWAVDLASLGPAASRAQRLEAGLAPEPGREIVGLDPEPRSIGLKGRDGFENDPDEVVGHGRKGDLRAGKHRVLAPLALPRSA